MSIRDMEKSQHQVTYKCPGKSLPKPKEPHFADGEEADGLGGAAEEEAPGVNTG